jgi:hypothetical protein
VSHLLLVMDASDEPGIEATFAPLVGQRVAVLQTRASLLNDQLGGGRHHACHLSGSSCRQSEEFRLLAKTSNLLNPLKVLGPV